MQAIGLRAIEILACCISVGPKILRALSDVLFHHRRAVARGHVVGVVAGIDERRAVLEERVAAARDALPFTVGIIVAARRGAVRIGACKGTADASGFRQYVFRLLVRFEWLAFLDS